jgi:hypothetical protein
LGQQGVDLLLHVEQVCLESFKLCLKGSELAG